MIEKKVRFLSRGQKIVGVLHLPNKPVDRAIVMAHGITVDKDEGGIFVRTARALCKAGFAVLRFDFRGHGQSAGRSVDLTVAGEVNDLIAAVRYMKKYKKIGLLAASFGGAISAIYLAKQKSVDALVLWNPVLDFDSFLKLRTSWARKYFGMKSMKKLDTKGYLILGRKFKIGKPLIGDMKRLKPYKYLKKVSIPTAILHGDKDSIVPYADSMRYYKSLGGVKKLITIKGANHGFHEPGTHREQRAVNESIAWFKKYL